MSCGQRAQERTSSGRPRPLPCGRRASFVTTAPAQLSADPGTALLLPGPAVPSCHQSMASCGLSPLPAPRSPPSRARCHSQLSAWQQQARREFQSSPGEPKREARWSHWSQASAGLSLPASLLSTRDHVVITKDSSGLPARNALATAPTHPLSEGEGQAAGSQLVLPSTSACPAPVSPDRPTGPLPGRSS